MLLINIVNLAKREITRLSLCLYS